VPFPLDQSGVNDAAGLALGYLPCAAGQPQSLGGGGGAAVNIVAGRLKTYL
jgi:hypothetical protein